MQTAPTPEAADESDQCLECGSDPDAGSGWSDPNHCASCGRALGSTPIATSAALDASLRLGGRRALTGPRVKPAGARPIPRIPRAKPVRPADRKGATER